MSNLLKASAAIFLSLKHNSVQGYILPGSVSIA